MFGDQESIIALIVALLIAYGVVLSLGTIVWTYRDIRERTRDGWSQAVSVLLVLAFNVLGLFLYLILRPRETLTEAYERRLEAEAVMRDLPEQHACPSCQRPMEEEYLVCPFCRTKLREPCSGCGRGLDLRWAACPFCGAQGPQAVAPATTMGELDSPPAPEPAPPPAEAGAPPAPTGTTAPPEADPRP